MKNRSKWLKFLAFTFIIAAFSALMLISVNAETVASGDFTKGNANATWTWSLDSDGTLTVGGTAKDGSTVFTYGADVGRSNCPWKRTGVIGDIQIKKIVILEETGITELGKSAIAYLPYMEELVIPSTLTKIANYESLFACRSLKTVSVHGVTDAGEGIYDFRNLTVLGNTTLRYNALASNVPNGIEVWLGENTTIPTSTNWYWFAPFNSVTWESDGDPIEDSTNTAPYSDMTTKVTFKVYKGSSAATNILNKIAQQEKYDATATELGGIDRTMPLNIEVKSIAAGGNFTGYNANATWTWELDTDGTLTIGGKSADGSTVFTYGADIGRSYCPWKRTGVIGDVQIKKIVILEETGITELGKSAIAYLPYMEELVIPSTLTKISSYEALFACRSLKTVSVHGTTDAGEGIYDFRNLTLLGHSTMQFNALASNVPSGIEVWLGENTSIPSLANWKWFAPFNEVTWASNGDPTEDSTNTEPYSDMTAKVTFKVYKGSAAAANILNKIAQQEKFDATATDLGGIDRTMPLNIEIKYYLPPLSGTETKYGWYSWELDLDTGTLTFERLYDGWCELYFPKPSEAEGTFMAWIENWRDEIKHIVVPQFSQYQDTRHLYPFSNLPNLETVRWDTVTVQNSGAHDDGYGMFYGCKKLTSFGSSENFEKGVINLSGIKFKSISTDVYSKNMFYGCEAIKKVVLDDIAYYNGDTVLTNLVPIVLGVSMFEGCSALAEIDISGVDGILSNAFKDCSSLKGEICYYGDTSITNAFDGCGGVIIKTDEPKKAIAMAASMNEAGVNASEAMVAGMTHGGFAVRVSGKNGLRCFYNFAGESNVKVNGYTLVEYGSLCGSADNYSKYTQDFGNPSSILTLEETDKGLEFKTSHEKIVKTAVYIADGYTGDIAKFKTENADGSVSFTVTVTDFSSDLYKSGVIMTGYEIWKDADGNYIVIFTEVNNDNYKKASLYKVTMAMLIDDVIDIGAENGPVFAVLNAYEQTPLDVGNDAVKAFLIDHHILDGKYIAVYRTDSATKIELEKSGISTEYIDDVADFIFDGNVSCEIPSIDDYWKEHIGSQLAALPEGKSFIAITDTHYQSEGYGNIGKSADLMEYVRKLTGIQKVVNLGDPFHQENSYKGAMEQLSRSMEEKFFDYFGDDGLYAIGNHDSNITIARTTGDSDLNTYKMDLILSDTDIYNTTFAHIEAGGKENGNVVYDEALIDIIKANKSDIKAFVLENVAAEDAASYNNLFGTANYTAEQMYENLLCWAKMHYAYYDHESKICYLVLNTGGLTLSDFTTLNRELWKFHPSQYNFVATILNQVSESYSDYDVVVAGHMFYDRSVAGESYNKDLFKMLSAFEGGTSVSFSASGNNALSGKLFGCTDGATSKTFSFDFTDRKFTGDIICLTGHRHMDLDLVSQTNTDKTFDTSVSYDSVGDSLSDNAILCLMLNQDNAKEKNGTAEPNVQTPVEGTITEQCFTIFTITEDNTLIATRIGANSGWTQKTYNLG